jgi:GTP-sensing pleiotropic transcriptional regulator CodY
MSAMKEIQSAISKLSKSDLSAFRAWFDEFDAKVWDKKIEEDVASGKLDKVAEQAIADYKAGKCKEL